MTVPHCRDCGTQIMFVRLENSPTGNVMPVDPFPDPDGNVYARHVRDIGGLLGHVAHGNERLPDGWRIYMPHFASCPMRTGARELTEPPPDDYERPAYLDPEPTLFDQPTEERHQP